MWLETNSSRKHYSFRDKKKELSASETTTERRAPTLRQILAPLLSSRKSLNGVLDCEITVTKDVCYIQHYNSRLGIPMIYACASGRQA